MKRIIYSEIQLTANKWFTHLQVATAVFQIVEIDGLFYKHTYNYPGDINDQLKVGLDSEMQPYLKDDPEKMLQLAIGLCKKQEPIVEELVLQICE
jgi:hypothetical protein